MTYYTDHKEYLQKQIYSRRKRIIQLVNELKLGKKCKKCKSECLKKYLKKYHYHHKDPSQKEFGISNGATRGYSIERIKKEIKKCILLCQECHSSVYGCFEYPTKQQGRREREIQEGEGGEEIA